MYTGHLISSNKLEWKLQKLTMQSAIKCACRIVVFSLQLIEIYKEDKDTYLSFKL